MNRRLLVVLGLVALVMCVEWSRDDGTNRQTLTPITQTPVERQDLGVKVEGASPSPGGDLQDSIVRDRARSAAANAPGVYYVTVDQTHERLAPSPSAQSTNRIYRQQTVDVFEVRNGWARVSRFYDGSVEGVSGEVARWVLAAHLGKQRPADLSQPKVERDPRIAKGAIGKVGDFGMTENDVRILYRGAKHFLDTGRCARVELGMKSGSKANTYFINCGEPQNIFFTAADLP